MFQMEGAEAHGRVFRVFGKIPKSEWCSSFEYSCKNSLVVAAPGGFVLGVAVETEASMTGVFHISAVSRSVKVIAQ